MIELSKGAQARTQPQMHTTEVHNLKHPLNFAPSPSLALQKSLPSMMDLNQIFKVIELLVLRKFSNYLPILIIINTIFERLCLKY